MDFEENSEEENISENLRDRKEINVIEHLLGLGIFSAKDDHKHGVFSRIGLIFV